MKIVIDIETLGRRNDAAITQIGVVVADDNYDIRYEQLFCIIAYEWNTCNRTFTGESLLKLIQQKNIIPTKNQTYFYSCVLDELKSLIHNCRSTSTFIYAKDIMDLASLKDLYEFFEKDVPWEPWQLKDIKTIKDYVPNWKTTKNNTNNALTNALNQLEEMKINLSK